MKPWCESKDILVIEKGDREFLIDTEGRRYIDGVSSLWCNVHGHCVPELDAAVSAQLQKVAHSTLLGLANVPSILLAKRLIELVHAAGLNLSRVFYSDNGSTAVEVACKMAYQYWRNLSSTVPQTNTPSSATFSGVAPQRPASPSENPPTNLSTLPAEPRSKFLALASAYHGDTLGAVSVGGIPLFHHAFKSLCFPVDFAPPPSPVDRGTASLAYLDQLLSQHPTAYAAIIIEPLVQGAGGMLMHPPSFLRQLRTLASRHNTLLIYDEVLTGFGRTGKMFASEHAALPTPSMPQCLSASVPSPLPSPDLLCLSKGLTAGYMPLGITLASQKIFDAFYVDPNAPGNLAKTFFHGHTFTGHPLACAVALASLDLFAQNHLLDHVATLIPILADMLEKARTLPHVADARHTGLIGAIDLVNSDGTPFPPAFRLGGEFCRLLRPRGILLRPLADTLVIMPPLAITKDNMHYLCHTILDLLADLPAIITAKQKQHTPQAG
jgi:adenosylmethionine-8-amino-7-oxononanoate aminotransferase